MNYVMDSFRHELGLKIVTHCVVSSRLSVTEFCEINVRQLSACVVGSCSYYDTNDFIEFVVYW